MASSTSRHRPQDQPLTDYDVLIVGAGSAGLSAALTLGRCLRRVLVCDGGDPRNAPSPAVHGFLSRDGIKPAELLRLGREQLAPYPSVELRTARVLEIKPLAYGFEIIAETENSRSFTITARKVLLSTGVEDELPPLDGMRELWGVGVLHCPYCHGWEVRDQPLAVYGRGKGVTGLALLVSRWSPDVVVCTDGPGGLTDHARQRLARQKIQVREEVVKCLEGTKKGELRHVVFETGEPLARHALFVHPHQHQRTQFAEHLGCRITGKGAIWIDKKQQTSLPGLYAAGDNTSGLQQALLAAAEGAKAAININETLTREECPK
ncbi:NAD(P)/FAD-dependent oxidoreductase [Hymenobacter sp. BT491]|uniref:NAD(P)/FAD-dependent oxidoreductase n=1 Tax=Hymenobacter sp. BT491 TaxID=2766779 RepID=UPI001653A387|nr:NAD(P)/FAD-dependent oxidoreductase [Hymenobacter sp. BT491]MBC6991284.1 NAD(P)/FAD-dependent oxidoreductase [Hymenobacter sp. BT491]